MKVKTRYKCGSCQYISTKWIGKCPNCNEWNSFAEEDQVVSTVRKQQSGTIITPQSLALDANKVSQPIATNIHELDHTLSGGIHPGSLILLGGEPGIGKSTITLQMCNAFVQQSKTVLYISGEEGQAQVAQRAQRIHPDLLAVHFMQEYSLENIVATIHDVKPDFVVIDSIQVIASEMLPGMAGSITQVRYCTEVLMELTKKNNLTTLLIGHVTKEGNLAGPRILEHLVDVVLHMEGDRDRTMRMVRLLKNRFGPTHEVGILEMAEDGLRSIDNPAEMLLNDRPEGVVGSALGCIVEGRRPLIIEVQALCTKSVFGYPKRSATGYDANRLTMLLAVMAKHLKINTLNSDVFINIIGGFTVKDPGVDVAVCAAIYSSLSGIPLGSRDVFLGEVGLSGEVRKSNLQTRRTQAITSLKLNPVAELTYLRDIARLIKQS